MKSHRSLSDEEETVVIKRRRNYQELAERKLEPVAVKEDAVESKAFEEKSSTETLANSEQVTSKTLYAPSGAIINVSLQCTDADIEETLREPVVQHHLFGQCWSVARFDKLGRLGEGSYGIVYLARDCVTKRQVALKRIHMHEEEDGLPVTSLRELASLRRLHHPNVVGLLGVACGVQLDSWFLVMERGHCDLATWMENDRQHRANRDSIGEDQGLSLPFIATLARQLAAGLAFCHSHFLMHRDIKLSNLLITDRGELKIADFGLARQFTEPAQPLTPRVVTLWYRAPELLLGDPCYTKAIDLWSMGCVLAELYKGSALMPGKDDLDQLFQICKVLGTPNERVWPDIRLLPLFGTVQWPRQPLNHLKRLCSKPHLALGEEWISFLNGLLTFDPKKRLTAKEALQHEWLDKQSRDEKEQRRHLAQRLFHHKR